MGQGTGVKFKGVKRPLFALKTLLFSFLLTSLYIYRPALGGDTPARQEWKLDDTYNGVHRTEYDQLRWKIPSLMRQTEINLAVRTGLNFQDGWRYPLLIRFVDGAQPGIE